MRIRLVLIVLVAVVVGTVAYLAFRPRGPGELNVLLITLDTTRADHLACYGDTNAQTPNLDRLAAEGTLFTRCSTCVPQTLPSHSSIMTGTYPYVHGVRRNGTDRLDEAAVTLAETLEQAGFRTQATVASVVLNAPTGIDQGFGTFQDVTAGGEGSDLDRAERKGNDVCNHAIKMLRSMADGRFFLWVHFFDPHYPYESKRFGDIASREAYADEITFMDHQVGRLLETLDELRIRDRTLVVIVGDHGEDLTDHGELDHGYFIYETTLHVPLIFRCPGAVPAGRRIDGQVRTIDIAPTILDLTGATPLADAQGISLAPLLAETPRRMELASYGEAMEAHALLGWSRLRSITAGGWKYILTPHPQLYNLEDDSAEAHNVIAEHPEVAARLHQQLQTLIADAPPRITAAGGPVAMSAEETARLESLGYVGGVETSDEQIASELDIFEPEGADPTDQAATLALYTQARRLMNIGRHAQAEEQFREVVRLLPNSLYPLRDLALVLHRQKKYDEAVEVYEQALAAKPGDRQTRLMLATMLVETGRLEEAIPHLEQIIAANPDDVSAHFILANTLRTLSRPDAAREQYEAALRLDPQHAQAAYMLGKLCYEQKQFPDAVKYLRKALELEPTAAPVRQALERAEQALQP